MMSKRSGSGNSVASRLADAYRKITGCPCLMVLPPIWIFWLGVRFRPCLAMRSSSGRSRFSSSSGTDEELATPAIW